MKTLNGLNGALVQTDNGSQNDAVDDNWAVTRHPIDPNAGPPTLTNADDTNTQRCSVVY